MPRLGRRSLLLGLSTAAVFGRSRVAFSSPAVLSRTEARLVVVLLRGALDGLSAVSPYGDQDFEALRGRSSVVEPGRDGGLLDLGGFYGLHPSMHNLHSFYSNNEALLLHAVAGPYRTRSHFDAQDMLESGASERLSSGWLNRAIGELPCNAEGSGSRVGMVLGQNVPLLLRGSREVGMYSPPMSASPQEDLFFQFADLVHADPLLGPPVAEALRARSLYRDVLDGRVQRGGSFQQLAAAAGRLLAAANGPRVAALELGGWDTHVAQKNRLAVSLMQLDQGLGAIRAAIGEIWKNTVIMVLTEFGRTARLNGNGGTDHGTGGVALLVGGAVAGGRLNADWPGLSQSKLYEGRDLQPTMDLTEVIKGVLLGHLKLSPAAVDATFPGSIATTARRGLLR